MDKLKTIIRLHLVGFFESLGLDVPHEAKIEQFVEGIMEDLMRQVAPPDLWKKANGMSKQNKKTFYEMVCHHACLDKDSWTVKNAFDKATNDLKGEQNGKN